MTEATVNQMAKTARSAARQVASAPPDKKNAALLMAAERIENDTDHILAVNGQDRDEAIAAGRSEAFVDRLTLTDKRVSSICRALRELAAFDDPVGERISAWSQPNGLEIERIRTPIGVIAVIYESRPNVTIDAAAIALKAGNAVILRGGSECIATSKALFSRFQDALTEQSLPAGAAQLIETRDRAAVGALLSGSDGNIDLVIPRGGKSLVARVQDEARVAVLSHLDGICHVYIDRNAELEKAIAIAVNSKMRRTGVCGAAETLLIDKECVETIWPPLSRQLREAGCELRGDHTIVSLDQSIALATDEDWRTEYLAPIFSIACVNGVEGAIRHITEYSSGHTESIVTENQATADAFLAEVDSAIVLHNASTQFADGGEFGLGAEIGIATGRLHARGPVGVRELTTFKNVVRGSGQIRPV